MLKVIEREASRKVFCFCLERYGWWDVIPATEVELTWVKLVWRENRELWIDHTLSLRCHYISL